MNNYFGTQPSNNPFGGPTGGPTQQQPNRRQVNYTARPFSDLVDEEKRPFVKRRLCATLLGGYRLVYNEGDDESYIKWYMHIFQILIYLIMPAIVIIMTQIFKENRTTGVILGGIIPLVINAILQIASYAVQRRINKDSSLAKVAMDMSEPSCCSAQSFLFLITPRSSVIELIFVILLTGVYGALMTYFIHSYTFAFYFFDQPDSYAQINTYYIITIITIFFSSYSLFSKPIPESTPYLTNDSISIFSHHYSRVGYSLIISGCICIIEFATDIYTMEYFRTQMITPYWLNLAILIAQMIGILSSPMVTITWLLEQIDIHIFGSTPRASDLRVYLSFFLNAVFIVAIYLVAVYVALSYAFILAVILSFLSSHNVFFNIGILKPFKVINEKYQQQQEYSNIVFSQTKINQNVPMTSKYKRSGNSTARTIIGIFLRSILPWGVVIGLNVIVVLYIILPKDQISIDGYVEVLDHRPIIYGLIIASFVLTGICYIVSAVYRRAIFRFIPCCHKQGSPEILIQILKLLIIFMLTFAYSCLSMLSVFDLTDLIFVYRYFNRLYHAPFASSLEAFLMFIYMIVTGYTYTPGPAIVFFAIHILLHRLMIFGNKCLYVLISIVTAYRNKKQRFKLQTICFIIQFTMMLPFLLFVILITTVLNTATIPYLGFAYFIIGYPKPQRGWSAISPVQANPNDSRSDGHLYQAMQPQLHKQLQQIFNYDPFNMRVGSYYLLKNEKMIILIQILERGNNYLVYTIKGTELQETTVCHAEENENINQISEQIFKNKKPGCFFPFSLSPIKEMGFGIYDDQKAALTGIIDNPDFATLVKKVFIRALAMKFKEHAQQNSQVKYYKIFKGDLTQKEIDTVQKYFDPSWNNHIHLDHQTFIFTQDNIPKTQDSQVKVKMTNVMPLRQSGSLPGTQNKPSTNFLQMLEDNQSNRQQQQSYHTQMSGGAVRPMNNNISAVSQANRQEESKTNANLEDDLDGLLSPDKMKKRNNQLPPLDANRSKEGSNVNDLDDLDDFLGNANTTKKQNNNQSKPLVKNNPDPWSNQGISKPQSTKDDDDPWSNNNNNYVNFNRKEEVVTQPSSQQQNQYPASTGPSSVSGPNMSDIQRLIYQSFLLCFREEHASVPHTLYKLFKGEFTRDMESGDFISSSDKSILHMKYVILQSLRLAFHYSVESFIMGEFEVPSHQELEKELRQMDSEWFFAGEEFLWNSAIEQGFPSLERIIEKKGSYFAHRLRYGQVDESKFYVYQFRSEVVRSIWANINMELFYYTNANDERFSIQAEKDILRNILVQLAEIPLGYPVYSSGAQIIYY